MSFCHRCPSVPHRWLYFWETAIQELIQQIINGLSVGAIYALIAVGYTMVYGVLQLINFAHGDVFMIGAMMTLVSARKFGFAAAANSNEMKWWWAFLLCAGIAITICGRSEERRVGTEG